MSRLAPLAFAPINIDPEVFAILGVVGFVLVGLGFFLMLVMLLRPNVHFLQWSVVCIVVGTALTFTMGSLVGVVTLLVVILALPTLGAAAWYLWTQTPIGRQAPVVPAGGNVKDIPKIQALENLLGQTGRTVTVMRPSGKVDFNGERIDAIAEGIMIKAGQPVRCVEVQAGKVVVRPVDDPGDAIFR